MDESMVEGRNELGGGRFAIGLQIPRQASGDGITIATIQTVPNTILLRHPPHRRYHLHHHRHRHHHRRSLQLYSELSVFTASIRYRSWPTQPLLAAPRRLPSPIQPTPRI